MPCSPLPHPPTHEALRLLASPQVKQKKKLKFESLRASLLAPELVLSDFAKFAHPRQLHYGVQALHAYAADHGGTLPPPSDAAAAEEVLERARAIAKQAADDEVDFSPRLMRNLASGARGELSPMRAACLLEHLLTLHPHSHPSHHPPPFPRATTASPKSHTSLDPITLTPQATAAPKFSHPSRNHLHHPLTPPYATTSTSISQTLT